MDKLEKNGLGKRSKLNKFYPKGRTNLFTASHYDIVK